MSYIFGPVPSRRLGYSLGIDIVDFKNCSLNCIYCQLGKTTNLTVRRREYVKIKHVISELKNILSQGKRIDYITLSGSGEPTLNSRIGVLIKNIKLITSIPVAVITNATLMCRANVRRELLNADVVIPSLDAVTQRTFIKINKPYSTLKIKDIINSLVQFRRQFKGKIWLEIMLVKDINDNESELKHFKRIIGDIRPDKIQLNTVVRPPADDSAKAITGARLRWIKDYLGQNCEIIQDISIDRYEHYINDPSKSILTIIKRHPMTVDDISLCLGLEKSEVMNHVDRLIKAKRIISTVHEKRKYYLTN